MKTIMAAVMVGVLIMASSAQAAPAPSACETKRQDVLKKIEQAKKLDDTKTVEDLTLALKDIESHCDSAMQQLPRQQQIDMATEDVARKKAKMEDARAAFHAARETGDPFAVDKARENFYQTRKELYQAQDQLKAVQSVTSK